MAFRNMAFRITGFFAALLAIVYFVLSLACIKTRKAARISVGEGTPVNKVLQKQIRVLFLPTRF